MSIRFAALVVTAGLTVACANRTSTTAGGGATPPPPAQTSGSGQAAGGGAAGGGATGAAAPARGGGPGAQAAARMTPEQLEAAMKSISTANGSLQKNLKSAAMADAAKDAQQLATLFGDVERFFAQNNQPEAVKLAQSARTGATEAAGAATAGDAAKVQAGAAAIGATCKQCHSAFREGDATTGYRLKAGILKP